MSTPTITKRCAACSGTKPEQQFASDGRRGLRPDCNTCRNTKRRARGEKGGRRETPDERRARLLWKWYRLTPEQYTALLAAQNGVCAICQRSPEAGKQLAVDHCHDTGVIRALLCTACNTAVGTYEIYRQKAEQYLAQYGVGNPLLKQ